MEKDLGFWCLPALAAPLAFWKGSTQVQVFPSRRTTTGMSPASVVERAAGQTPHVTYGRLGIVLMQIPSVCQTESQDNSQEMSA